MYPEFGRQANPEYKQVMSAHMADSTYVVDAEAESATNIAPSRGSRVVADIDVTGDSVVDTIGGGDTTASLAGGTAKRKGGKGSGKSGAVAGAVASRRVV